MFLCAMAVLHVTLLVRSVEENAGEYSRTEAYGNVALCAAVAAAGVCLWLAVLSRMSAASSTAEPSAAGRS